MMDAGLPIVTMIEPILLHGVQEGKWSMDMALGLMEPLSVIMYGLGKRAGIEPTIISDKFKEDPGIDSTPISEIFKKEVGKRKEALLGSLDKKEVKEETEELSSSLLGRTK